MTTLGDKVLKRLMAPRRYIRNEMRRIQGERKKNIINVFWWEEYPNFGDDLNRLLLEKNGFTPVRQSPSGADLVFIGSILDMVPDDYRGIIMGSGFRTDGHRRALSNAKILAVRGHLTADRLSLSSSERVVGDPGLLVSTFAQRQKPLYEIGLLPHLSDRTAPSFNKLGKNLSNRCCIIDPRQKAESVIGQISKCALLFSSSLHGLIIADSLGIPSRWIHLSEDAVPAFKFHDYYSAFEETRLPVQIDGNESFQSLLEIALKPPLRILEVTSSLLSTVEAFLSAHASVKSLSRKT
ncbi:MAG: polysaccharide pyruvyl transferase family protein [Prochlorococcaceae cyanobacterium]